MSVYVHIPFCDYRCHYCNFVFETGWSPALLQKTLDAIVAEASRELERCTREGIEPRFHTLYLGGGTPGIIPPNQIVPFFSRLNDALGVSGSWQEVGFEVNPENVTPELLAELAEAGVNRLSVGLQSFSTERLQLLGRWCTRETNLRALELLSRHWRGSWSADLMTGLPGEAGGQGQTWRELKSDLETLLAFEPPHVSLYSLIVEPETALHSLISSKKLTAASAPMQDQLWLSAKSHLEHHGFEWYEISNFARPGNRSLHNPVYWRMDHWMGLGPGAEGNLVARDAKGEYRPLRTRNGRLFPWLTGGESARTEELLTAPEYLLEHFLTGWRTSDGLSATRLAQVFQNLPDHLELCLTDDQRLALNRHLEALPGFEETKLRKGWLDGPHDLS